MHTFSWSSGCYFQPFAEIGVNRAHTKFSRRLVVRPDLTAVLFRLPLPRRNKNLLPKGRKRFAYFCASKVGEIYRIPEVSSAFPADCETCIFILIALITRLPEFLILD